MFPNSCNAQGTGAPQFGGCTPNQMQNPNQPNMIRCQNQTPGFCQPHGPGCDCRMSPGPGANYMQPNSMMGAGQGVMPSNFGRPMSNQAYPQNQNQNQQQQQRMMQQMLGMQPQHQPGGNTQFGQNACPNMQRNMNPNMQQPFNTDFNSY